MFAAAAEMGLLIAVAELVPFVPGSEVVAVIEQAKPAFTSFAAGEATSRRQLGKLRLQSRHLTEPKN